PSDLDRPQARSSTSKRDGGVEASAILRPYRSANLDQLDLRSDQMEAWHDAVVLHDHDETPLPQHERGRPRRKCSAIPRAGAGCEVSPMGDFRSRNAAAHPRQLQEGDT